MRVIGTCRRCGDVRLTLAALTVRVCIDTDERTCTYQCPDCGAGCVRTLCRVFSLRLVVDLRVPVVYWRYPLELREEHHGPPIGYGDVSAFVRAMRDEDQLARLAAR